MTVFSDFFYLSIFELGLGCCLGRTKSFAQFAIVFLAFLNHYLVIVFFNARIVKIATVGTLVYTSRADDSIFNVYNRSLTIALFFIREWRNVNV